MSNVITLVENQNNFTLAATIEGNDGLSIEAVWNGKSLGTAEFGYTGDGDVGDMSEHDKVYLIAQGTNQIAEMFPVRAMLGDVDVTQEDLEALRSDLSDFSDYINQAIDELHDSE